VAYRPDAEANQGKPVTTRGDGSPNQAVRPHRKSGAVPQL